MSYGRQQSRKHDKTLDGNCMNDADVKSLLSILKFELDLDDDAKTLFNPA